MSADHNNTEELLQELHRLPGSECEATLYRWLTWNSPARRELAAEALRRLGPSGVPRLLREALNPRRRPESALRFLDVIARIGAPLGPDAFFIATAAIGRAHPVVKQRLVRLIAELRAVPAPVPEHRPQARGGGIA